MADRILTVDQLINELKNYNHMELHVHHTWKPDHSNWRQRPNAQHWQNSIRSYHVNTLGWADIGQHVTLTPDGKFITGRSFSKQPASIKGYNSINGGIPFMVEMLGNFDIGNDKFEGAQKASMLKLAKWFDDRGKNIRFHRENASKTCPGTGIDKAQFMREVRGQTSSGSIGAGNISTVLRRGSRGTQVRYLQMNLTGLGYKGVFIDGMYGPGTESGVKRFQKAEGLSADGIAGTNTLNKMDSIIRGLQSNLNKLGYNVGKVDGVFGNGTKNAVIAFQRDYGLTADGIPGKNTFSKIEEAIKNKDSNNDKLYRVQTGAFSRSGNADNLVKELKKKGYDAIVVRNKGLYKVQTGAFSKRENADKLVAKLRRDGFEAIVI